MADTIGASITLTSTRTLYWDVVTDAIVNGNPAVAIIDSFDEPDPATVWNNATWVGPDVAEDVGTPSEKHTRRLSLLVAGPAGPTTGNPVVVPAGGEYGTWVRVNTTSERIEVPADLLVVG
jgi:hypothetical protein